MLMCHQVFADIYKGEDVVVHVLQEKAIQKSLFVKKIDAMHFETMSVCRGQMGRAMRKAQPV
jgi:hypothetical protein